MSWNSKLVSRIPDVHEIKREFPLTQPALHIIEIARGNIESILNGTSKRKLLILGPCSADFPESLGEYSKHIARWRQQYASKIEIVMRYYTGKPRTVGGWKGLGNSRPWEKTDISRGLLDARDLAISLIDTYGIPLADEMLHPQLSHLFDDVFSYLAVWARSTENQYHREVASGSDIPIGFKNPTSWDIDVMTNSIKAWQTPSSYTLGDHIYDTSWNPYAHGILRGGRIDGKNFSNYHQELIAELIAYFQAKKISNPAFLVDTNHENSNKQYQEQQQIMERIFENVQALENAWISADNYFKGCMTESYLFDGRQDRSDERQEVKKGCSLTDPCIGLEKTERFLESMASRINVDE